MTSNVLTYRDWIGRQLSLQLVSVLEAVLGFLYFQVILFILGILTALKTSYNLIANPGNLALRKYISEDSFQIVNKLNWDITEKEL